jgi:hypothetical protein
MKEMKSVKSDHHKLYPLLGTCAASFFAPSCKKLVKTPKHALFRVSMRLWASELKL